MRNIAPRICLLCGKQYIPSGPSQMYCEPCRKIKRCEYENRYDKKRHKRRSAPEPCCVCGGDFSAFYDGKPYCNKHYQRMRNHGTPDKLVRKSKNAFCEQDGVLEITTSDGRKIIADLSDTDILKKYSWCISKTGYAVANIQGRVRKMHRYIIGEENCIGKVIDHKNGNPLDNRRANLRVCTVAENTRNVRASKSNETGVLGVSKTKNGRFRARIVADGIEHHIGTFDTVEEAVKARNEAENTYHGDFGSHRYEKEENEHE